MSNRIKSNPRLIGWAITGNVVALGAGTTVLTWMIFTYPEHPQWYDRVGMAIWITLVVLNIVNLVLMLYALRLQRPADVEVEGLVWRDRRPPVRTREDVDSWDWDSPDR